jgi:hypothetical protein
VITTTETLSRGEAVLNPFRIAFNSIFESWGCLREIEKLKISVPRLNNK